VMAIDRAFEPALMKAIRSLEVGIYGLASKTAYQLSDMELEDAIRIPNDERLWAITEAFRRGVMVEEIHSLSAIDPWFLRKLRHLVEIETLIKQSRDLIASASQTASENDAEAERILRIIKRAGFADKTIAEFTGQPEMNIRALRKRLGIVPIYKMVDTCAAEFEAETPYYYSSYDTEDER
jgi:carbamoyl-phosphate synthase large subunit